MGRLCGESCFVWLVIVVRHAGIPLLEGRVQGAVKGLRAGLQQKMCADPAPLHLLFFREPLGDDGIDGCLDEGRGNALTGPVAFAVVDQA